MLFPTPGGWVAENELCVPMQGFPEEHTVRMCVLDKVPAAVIEVLEVIREHIFFRLVWGKRTMKTEFCGPFRPEK